MNKSFKLYLQPLFENGSLYVGFYQIQNYFKMSIRNKCDGHSITSSNNSKRHGGFIAEYILKKRYECNANV